MMAEQTVYIVDDDEAMRDSLKWLLESRSLKVQIFASGEEFLGALQGDLAGCMVLDVRMPGMNGLELYEQLQVRGCALPAIFITGHGDVPMAVSALKRGAADFIEKPFNDQEMLSLIERCMEQDRTAGRKRAETAAAALHLSSLTQREREVLDLIVTGKLNKQVADELNISIKTVEVHRSRVMEKMAVASIAELVQLVIKTRA